MMPHPIGSDFAPKFHQLDDLRLNVGDVHVQNWLVMRNPVPEPVDLPYQRLDFMTPLVVGQAWKRDIRLGSPQISVFIAKQVGPEVEGELGNHLPALVRPSSFHCLVQSP